MGFTSEHSSPTSLQTEFLRSGHIHMPGSRSPSNDTSDGSPPASRPRQLPGAACSECRRRKLRCDRQKPRCSACQASDVGCIVPAAKPARGPKRGYLKTLQERISVLEGVLKEHQSLSQSSPVAEGVANLSLSMSAMKNVPGTRDTVEMIETEEISDRSLGRSPWSLDLLGERDLLPISHHLAPYQENDQVSTADVEEGWHTLPQDFAYSDVSSLIPVNQSIFPPSDSATGPSLQPSTTHTYARSEVSLEFAMSHLVQSDLDQLYVDRIHEFVPIVHHDSVNESQMALRYAMWTLAASASAYHLALRDTLYHRTRQLLESPNHTSSDGNTSNTETVQAWLLLAIHELMCVNFRCAWMSAGRAFRLIQLDTTWTAEPGPAADDNIPSGHAYHLQWVEVEQRRRTFWFAYCLDRLLSLRNGSCPMLSERVRVRLPCPDTGFQYGQPIQMGCLLDTYILTPAATSVRDPMSPFSQCVVVAAVAGRVLSHHLDVTLDAVTNQEGRGTNSHNGWDSLSLVESLVSRGMRDFATHHPPTTQERDPMLLFLAMVWRATVIYLWHTAESIPTPTPSRNHAMKIKLFQQAESAVHEMLRLMSKLSGWSSWKIHPLMNIPLSLCAELLTPRPDLMEAFTQKAKEITQATPGLRVLPVP
ncbi:fungal-specific transcription factor domain-containing protein [Xylaria grammica]|nr:fungal-specific transcription factor domain-containing protein [Xylaria grammica]